MSDMHIARRQFLKLGTLISMSITITACSSAPSSDARATLPARLRLMALGGPVNDTARATRGIDYLRTIGFQVENQECVARRASRFAGSDAERLADLNTLADPLPDVLLATRGGYGAARLLPNIDYAGLCPRLKQQGTILMGYSDNTAVQLALLARGGVVSFSGPMLYGDFAAPEPSAFMRDWFQQVLTSESFTLRVDAEQADVCNVGGILWGGNLSVLTSLVGTPYLPNVPGGILFIEDVGEEVYRVERMLLQLWQSGVLGSQAALLLGQFSGSRPDGYDPDGYTLERMLAGLRERTGLPIVTGLPVGHVADIMPLPIGASARLISEPGGFSLAVQGYPTLKRWPAQFQNNGSNPLSQVKG